MNFALLIIWMLRDVEPYGGDHNFALYIIRFSSPNPKSNLSFCIVNYEFCIINWAQCSFFSFSMRCAGRRDAKKNPALRIGTDGAVRCAEPRCAKQFHGHRKKIDYCGESDGCLPKRNGWMAEAKTASLSHDDASRTPP